MINKNFSLLWIGQLVSQLGNRIYLMALSWYFVATLKDNHGLFILFIISSLPALLLGLYMGPFVERWNKKKIIVACDLLSGLLVTLLAFLVYMESHATLFIYIICFLLNTVNLFFSPSINSIIPAILSKNELQKGMSYIRMVTYLGQIMGAAVGGVLVGIVGVYITILINAISFFLSAIAGFMLNYKEQAQTVSKKYMGQVKDGLKYIYSYPLLRKMLFLAICCNLFLPALLVFIPIVIKTEMGLDAIHYGIADAAVPIGAVITAYALSRHKVQTSPLKMMGFGLSLLAVSYLLIFGIPYYGMIVSALFLFGCALNYININSLTFFTSMVEPDYRGRFFSLLESLSYASLSLSYLIANGLSGWIGLYETILINGLFLLFIAGISLFWSRKNKEKVIC